MAVEDLTYHAQRANNRYRFRKNQAAEGFGDLSRAGQDILNRIKLFEGITDAEGNTEYGSRVERLRQRAGEMGIDLTKFGGKGDAQAALDKFALAGPEWARLASRYSGYLQTSDARNAARNQAGAEIAQGYTDLGDQFRSFLPGPATRSGASEAVAANYAASRRQALFDAFQGINERTAVARANFDSNTLASIGDTLETMRALDEQKRLARIQAIISGVGAAGSVVGGIASLWPSGAAAGATMTPGSNPYYMDPNSWGGW